MASVLEIAIPVITGDELRRRHQGEQEVRFAAGTVVTPTAWDYVREAGLRYSRGAAAPPAGAAPAPAVGQPGRAEVARAEVTVGRAGATAQTTAAGAAPVPPRPAPAGDGAPLPKEVAPAQLVCVGRCDRPDASFGCATEEFGSGYAAAEAKPQAPAAEAAAAPLADPQIEELIQHITNLVMAELSKA